MQQPDDDDRQPTMLPIKQKDGSMRDEPALMMRQAHAWAKEHLGIKSYDTMLATLRRKGITIYQDTYHPGTRYVLVRDLERLRQERVTPVDDE